MATFTVAQMAWANEMLQGLGQRSVDDEIELRDRLLRLAAGQPGKLEQYLEYEQERGINLDLTNDEVEQNTFVVYLLNWALDAKTPA